MNRLLPLYSASYLFWSPLGSLKLRDAQQQSSLIIQDERIDGFKFPKFAIVCCCARKTGFHYNYLLLSASTQIYIITGKKGLLSIVRVVGDCTFQYTVENNSISSFLWVCGEGGGGLEVKTCLLKCEWEFCERYG